MIPTSVEEFKANLDRTTSIHMELPSIRTKDGWSTYDGKQIKQPRWSRFTNGTEVTKYEILMLISENNRMKAAIDSAWRTLNTI